MSMIGRAWHLGKQMKILNRTVVWKEDGIELIADKRHAEEIVKEAKLKDDRKSLVPAPVEEKVKPNEAWRGEVQEMDMTARKQRGRRLAEEIQDGRAEREAEELVPENEVRRFRGVAARANYLSQDRPDLKYAALKLCRCMSSPRTKDWALVERIARYLKARPVVACVFAWQGPDEKIIAYSDSDWAGDRITRRSTSGGCLMRGIHTIKCWAKTQHVIALSSGEAELFACVRAASESNGLQSVMRDMGVMAGIKVYVDASAAIGMLMKEGLSGVRHIDTQFLWVQAAVKKKEIAVKKVDGKLNTADMFTKALGSQELEGHLRRAGHRW